MENLFDIAMHLPVEDVLALCKTNQTWRSICNDDYLWQLLTERDFHVKHLPQYYTWREYYRSLQKFYKSNLYLTISLEYYGQGKRIVQQEYSRLVRDHKIFVEKTREPFMLVKTEPEYEIYGQGITFYFKVVPITDGLTISDFIGFVQKWQKIVALENKRGEENYITFGDYPNYIIS